LNNKIEILTLGTIQDGGYPHAGCNKECCMDAWHNPGMTKYVASIGIIDHINNKYWIIDITPDFKKQYQMINTYLNRSYEFSGIFITHAHTGHYTGLFELGLEVLNTHDIPLYVMPGLLNFFKKNISIDFLFKSNNVRPVKIEENENIILSNDVSINAFLVPHRNEMSETVGFKIKSNLKSVIYIPDIDAWEDWDVNIIDIIKTNNLVLIDGTFYNKDELQERNMLDVPHPLVLDSLDLFENLDMEDKNKIYFTHLNHTNSLVKQNSNEYKTLCDKGYHVLQDGDNFII
tara:strand:+ start:2116 stop:2982 length:867 start_codon:yes stop_codon:yes gene_type:complete